MGRYLLLMSIGSEKYVALTTYRKDGTPRSTAVWITELDDGQVGLITPASSWKVKRLANDDRVQLQPSDSKGNVRDGSSPVEGTAVVVEGADFEAVRQRVRAKYGLMYPLWGVGTAIARLIGKGDHRPNRGIVITLT